jgi:hypothetical protein
MLGIMVFHRIRMNWLIGCSCGVIFAILLTIRVGFLQREEGETRGGPSAVIFPQTERETWMNIFQKGQKIGYAHRQFSRTTEGHRIRESVFMQVNTLGMLQDIRLKTEGNFHPDLTFSSFRFELRSGFFSFKARGSQNGKMLTIFTEEAGTERRFDLPLQSDILLPVGLFEVLQGERLKPGEHKLFNVFDPATQAVRPVKVVVVGEETITVQGREEKARKLSVDFMGAPQVAWVGMDGTVLKEEGSLGIRLERVSKEEALETIVLSPGADLMELASIPANKILFDAHLLKELKLQLKGLEGGDLFVEGGRQQLEGAILSIRKEESFRETGFRPPGQERAPEVRKALSSTPFIQADHPEIVAKVKEIVSPGDPARVKAMKLISWVHEKIQKRPVLSVPNALETLNRRAGDCNEHAVLLAALARAAGIPAEVEAGLVYQNGRFYYHAWNILYLDQWVTADTAMGQFPADVTHVRFVRGTESQIDLVSLIGRLNVEILEAK